MGQFGLKNWQAFGNLASLDEKLIETMVYYTLIYSTDIVIYYSPQM